MSRQRLVRASTPRLTLVLFVLRVPCQLRRGGVNHMRASGLSNPHVRKTVVYYMQMTSVCAR